MVRCVPEDNGTFLGTHASLVNTAHQLAYPTLLTFYAVAASFAMLNVRLAIILVNCFQPWMVKLAI